MRAGCGRIPATSSSDARRAADLTSVEPQARYGAAGLGARAARFLARAGAVPAGGAVLGHWSGLSTWLGPSRSGVSCRPPSQPRGRRRGPGRSQ